MTSAFAFQGSASNLLFKVLTTTSPTIIPPTDQTGQYNLVWFRCNEYAGGTANLTVELYDVANTTSYYLGSGGFTWNAKALTAKQSVFFDDGYAIPNNWQLRVTASVANNVQITGLYVGKQAGTQWRPTGA